jgi:hypothetical protein
MVCDYWLQKHQKNPAKRAQDDPLKVKSGHGKATWIVGIILYGLDPSAIFKLQKQ